MADAAEMRRRLDLVERTMAEVGWSARIVRQLADQIGVETRTIYRYRAEVLKDIASAYEGGERDELRAEFLARVRSFQGDARRAGAWGSLNGLLNIECRVMGFDAPIEHKVSGSVEVADGTLEELAAFVRENLPRDEAARVLGETLGE